MRAGNRICQKQPSTLTRPLLPHVPRVHQAPAVGLLYGVDPLFCEVPRTVFPEWREFDALALSISPGVD